MSEEIVPGKIGIRKFVIWIIGNFTLSILLCVSVHGHQVMSDLVFRDCFIGLTGAVILGYAAEYFKKS